MEHEAELASSNLSDKLQSFILKFRYPLLIVLVGLILIGLGTFFVKTSTTSQNSSIEVLNEPSESQTGEIAVEVAGQVQNPGVYKLSLGDRVEDAIYLAGGFSVDADRNWVEKNLNRASKLSDGQKIYIPSEEETSNSDKQSNVMSANTEMVYQSGSSTFSGQNTGLTNINSANLSELDKLPGIGPVYGQKIIDQRPYSNTEELLTRSVVPKSTYEKIKDLISVN